MTDTKENTIIEYLKRPNSLNRFEAIRLGDTCLNSTISSLVRKGYGIRRQREKVPNRFNTETQVMRYWIDDKEKSGDAQTTKPLFDIN